MMKDNFVIFFPHASYCCWVQFACWIGIYINKSVVKYKCKVNETCYSVGNVAPVEFVQKQSWVSKNNAHSSSGCVPLSSGYLFTLKTLFYADTTPARRRLHWVSVKKKLNILYIGYMVSPPETGERTAITVIALLTGWGALSRQEERKH